MCFWGQPLSVTDASGNAILSSTHIANLNPFRYRAYHYDTETGLYYLNSRYYDPVVGRFLNADGYVSTGQGMTGYNMFAYCVGNPINLSESNSSSDDSLPASVAYENVKINAKISSDVMIYYNVPLYYQGAIGLCWACCQVMVEDYNEGITRTNKQARIRMQEISIKVYGYVSDEGGWPTNVSNLFSESGKAPPTLDELYSLLLKKGPVYAYYSGSSGAHLVVITGVNLTKGMVYTNNPWWISGKQTYEDFMKGFLGRPLDYDATFIFLIIPRKERRLV